MVVVGIVYSLNTKWPVVTLHDYDTNRDSDNIIIIMEISTKP